MREKIGQCFDHELYHVVVISMKVTSPYKPENDLILAENKNLLFDLSEHNLVFSKCLKVWDAFYIKMMCFFWCWE